MTDLDLGAIGVPDVIIDCSAEPSVLAGVASPQYVVQTNLLGTVNILELARQTGARLLFLSTSRVYSIPAIKRLSLIEQATRFCLAPEQPEWGVSDAGINEGFSIQGVRSLYGATKLASEMLIEEYREAFKLKTIINRCGVLTGPWQMGKVDQGVFVLWMAAHYFHRKLEYIGFGGTGKQVRDLLHVSDLLRLVKYELDNFDSLDGEVFNVGGGSAHSLSLLETTELCQEISGRTTEITRTLQERPADIAIFVTDNTKVTNRTGWTPQQTPRHCLQDIHLWIKENETILRPLLG
jgi:CDP-paratose 2-epimerase